MIFTFKNDRSNKKIIGIVGVVLTLGVLVFFISKLGLIQNVPDQVGQKTTPTLTNPFIGAKPTSMAQVRITRFGFIPGAITLVKGSQLTFKNEDKAPHQIMADQKTPLDGFDTNKSLRSNETFNYTFNKKGRYYYYDVLNPNSDRFKGTIIVVDNI